MSSLLPQETVVEVCLELVRKSFCFQFWEVVYCQGLERSMAAGRHSAGNHCYFQRMLQACEVMGGCAWAIAWQIWKEKYWSSWRALWAEAKVFDARHLHHSLFCRVPIHALAQVASSLAGGYFCHAFRWLAVKEAFASWVSAPREAFPLEPRACQEMPASFLV